MYAGVMAEKTVASWARGRARAHVPIERNNLGSVGSFGKARICMEHPGEYGSHSVQGPRRYRRQMEQHPGEDIQGGF